ncbi:hypothetical protein JBE04_20390 [Streptomyces sp. PRKS01-29]|nr:hypothetical protein [Streptomyces sabulosicollis]MBI0296753.1 hypothetical protein [Streptomyces sabulosicollis]
MTGRHRAVDKVRKLEAENTDLTCKLVALAGQVDQLQAQLDTAGIALTGAWSDLDKAVAEIRRLQQQHIGDAVTIARLRRQLANAQPRISVVPAEAERPTAPDSVPLTDQTEKEMA